ncbi:uncharacterized protein LOC111408619 [Olea europaea var. sylvestris]|uniref:uncharacterized protein LOC111408619 n=1 Tax=Olea europaea var. sylvestris TaxID=158386 RepID=UPI000C1D3A12|nr:uncharacterized protein LOC111408619 [Olea europaea var. sylvestris]
MGQMALVISSRAPSNLPRNTETNPEEKVMAIHILENKITGEHAKKLHINVSLIDAIRKIPNYAKFLKDVITKKKKLSKFETVALTEESSARLLKKLPPKLKDRGSFTLPISIGEVGFFNALCDTGASVNLMPLSIYKKLGLGEAKKTMMLLQLADRNIKFPRDKVEDVLIKSGKLVFSADFIILDRKEDKNISIILG